MNYTEKNGYKISELTLGTVQLGIPYGINNTYGMPDYEKSAEILTTALDNGILSFDTAKAYGKSEAVLGKYFSASDEEKTIITKVAFDNEPVCEVKESLFKKVRDSINILGIDKIPCLLLHSESYIETYGKTLTDALCELKKEGLVTDVGISFSSKEKLLEYTNPDIFTAVQIPMNMLDSTEISDRSVLKLYENGVSVYVRSVYLQGLFFKDTDTLPPKLQCAKDSLDRLHNLALDNNMSMQQMALSFIKDTKEITSLVMGCDTKEQLLESISLFDAPSLSDELKEKILDIAQSTPEIVIRPWEWNK